MLGHVQFNLELSSYNLEYLLQTSLKTGLHRETLSQEKEEEI